MSGGTGPAAASGRPADEGAAIGVQERLRGLVDVTGPGPDLSGGGTIAGVDVAYDDAGDRVAAAAVVLDAATHRVVGQATAVGRITFPYVSGLLAFRELPAVLDALAALGRAPDLIVCDGYGVAHPRRLGLASHLGVLTGIPAFGVAKSPFLYAFDPPGPERGASSPLLDGAETVGRALRTRTGVKPVFVSAGHLVDLDQACAHTLALSPRFRLPETTRLADRLCRAALAAG
ncbi:endonuclease V [Streptacidiphilus sp. EB129]|uniref:endonuclease V n=1 Tax=Streptacidiphilus sp. EB129 TaxID=3156262 RepID=UPI003517DB10